ncbi:MAG: hypothetical protein OEW11_09935 [Nitrospirota bacterium]|nr:hypothetical protein [Nitrospirota bacterium]
MRFAIGIAVIVWTAGLLLGTLAEPARAAEVIPGKLSINGYIDTLYGHNQNASGTSGFDVYHWVTLLNWQVNPWVRAYGDLTMEHGAIHDDNGVPRGEIKTRSFIQIRARETLNLNIGQFLMPFGHFNIVHDASPLFIQIGEPRSVYAKRVIGQDSSGLVDIKDRAFLKEGAGAWLFGRAVTLGGNLNAAWDLYVSNGRGSNGSVGQGAGDENQNKATGAHLLLGLPNHLSLGGSYFTERHAGLGNSAPDPRIAVWATEAQLKAGHLTLLAEQSVAEVDAHLTVPRHRGAGRYIQAEFAMHRLTPYARHEVYHNRKWPAGGEREEIGTLGVNLHLVPNMFLKFEHGFYAGARDVSQAEISVAF